MTFGDILRRVGKFTSDNSPTILTAMAVVGTLTTAYLTGKAAFRVGRDVNAGHYEPLMENLPPEIYDTKTLVKTYWKEFIPAVFTGCATVTCIIAANRVGTHRAAAMAVAYSLSEKAFAEYKAKVLERIGRPKEEAIRDGIAQDRVNADPVSNREVIIAGSGNVLCYDAFTGRYFSSSVEELKKAQNDTNYQINSDYYASLSDFYRRIGLPTTSYSDEVGWNADKLLELSFSTTLSEDGRPCVVINFSTVPIRDYYRLR